jgi:hypothetical protein
VSGGLSGTPVFFGSVEIEAMVLNINAKNLFEGRFYVLYARITKFEYLSGIGQYDVVVLLVLEGTFEMGRLVAKLMAAYQVALNEQFDGIVERGPGNAVFFVFHPHIERFNIEMSGIIVDLTQNGKAFRRLSVVVFDEIGRKNVPDGVLNGIHVDANLRLRQIATSPRFLTRANKPKVSRLCKQDNWATDTCYICNNFEKKNFELTA